MAERRMYSQRVVGSDEFCALHPMSQLLYLHLGLYADDDGFVACQRRVRLAIGATEADLQPLIDAGYIIPFDQGKVLCIAHWCVHNRVRPDRHKPTAYQQYLAQLALVDDVYALGSPSAGSCPPSGGSAPPDGGAGEVRIDQASIGEIRADGTAPSGSHSQDPNTSLDDHTMTLIRELHNQYPMRRRGALHDAVRAVMACGLDADHLRIALDHLPNWIECDQWQGEGGKYVKRLDNWLRSEDWRIKPLLPGKREMSNDEINAIQQMMEGPDY